MILIINNKKYNIKNMNTFFKRFIGNMFKLKINDILLFETNSIHTFFCFKKMDIIMLDKGYRVKYVFKNFKIFHIILPKKDVKYVLELPVGKINIKINDTLNIKRN